MGDSFEIRQWPVSYYQEKKWVNGILSCTPLAVTFTHDHTDVGASASPNSETVDTKSSMVDDHTQTPERQVIIDYSDIKKIEKATSLLVYAAVTVETNEGTVHWFSSLPDRYSVYNILHHFLTHNLTGRSDKKKTSKAGSAHTSRIGQQLLRSAEDSEATLAGAATDLHGQGRKLDRTSITLQEIHEDLHVADRLLSGLNTYLGQWKLPPQYKQVDLVEVKKGDVPEDQDLEVLSSELCKDQWRPQQLITVRISGPGLVFLDARQRVLHSLRWVELSRVFVVSPWEVIVSKHIPGHADFSVSVVSAALLPLLDALHRKVHHLVDFQKIPDKVRRTSPERKAESTKERKTAVKVRDLSSTQPPPVKASVDTELVTVSSGDQKGKQLQLEKEAPSDAELLALRSKLGGLKAMASAVGEELLSQNKSLDGMIASTEQADMRVTHLTARTKRLM